VAYNLPLDKYFFSKPCIASTQTQALCAILFLYNQVLLRTHQSSIGVLLPPLFNSLADSELEKHDADLASNGHHSECPFCQILASSDASESESLVRRLVEAWPYLPPHISVAIWTLVAAGLPGSVPEGGLHSPASRHRLQIAHSRIGTKTSVTLDGYQPNLEAMVRHKNSVDAMATGMELGTARATQLAIAICLAF
jgi:hypothetical protein